ncbi:MAG TPA: hypothetical protein VMW55_02655 [Nitrosopumilaceae archaeon]|nr:hypothetical protein [Nitrosopumilaceae archaeon]
MILLVSVRFVVDPIAALRLDDPIAALRLDDPIAALRLDDPIKILQFIPLLSNSNQTIFVRIQIRLFLSEFKYNKILILLYITV